MAPLRVLGDPHATLGARTGSRWSCRISPSLDVAHECRPVISEPKPPPPPAAVQEGDALPAPKPARREAASGKMIERLRNWRRLTPMASSSGGVHGTGGAAEVSSSAPPAGAGQRCDARLPSRSTASCGSGSASSGVSENPANAESTLAGLPVSWPWARSARRGGTREDEDALSRTTMAGMTIREEFHGCAPTDGGLVGWPRESSPGTTPKRPVGWRGRHRSVWRLEVSLNQHG